MTTTDEDRMNDGLPRLYTEFAPWYHLLTAPEDYEEEAAFYRNAWEEASSRPPRTLLELGSGGGNMASHYKHHIESTLTDLSAPMLAISGQINPECEHLQGDMRSLRLSRRFDVVFVHDAVMYLTTEEALRQGMLTAFVHCRPGGVAIFAPDYVRETFQPNTDHGGHDGEGRALRYLEWTWDPDPSDTTYLVDYVYLLREEGQPLRHAYDRHVEGLFGRDDWLRWLAETGFQARFVPFEHSEVPENPIQVFVAVRPEG